jgi:Peptidase family M23
MLTTKLPRLALPFLVFLVWTPAAYAWSWPVQGPVLQPFSYDPANPYAAGQHRGIDIGADATGDTVVAPAAGTISFAGTVPTSGRSVTIQTSDGYSVTLTHLGSALVAKGQTVAERDSIGTIGPSGTAEVEGPYVHLGIRVTSDPNGYLDPLSFLPPVPTDAGGDGSTSSQGSSSGSSTASGGASGSSASSSSTTAKERATSKPEHEHAATTQTASSRSGTRHGQAEERRSNVRQDRSSRRAAVPRADEATARTLPVAVPHRSMDVPTSSSRRPVVEPAAPVELTGLDAGHTIRRRPPGAHPVVLLPLILNGVAALVALGAALRTANGRRRSGTGPAASAQVLQLSRRPVENRAATRAA